MTTATVPTPISKVFPAKFAGKCGLCFNPYDLGTHIVKVEADVRGGVRNVWIPAAHAGGCPPPPARPALDAAPTADGKRIVARLNAAKDHLKFPKIRVTVATGSGDYRVGFRLKGDRSNDPGAVDIVGLDDLIDGTYGLRARWLGKVTRDGELTLSGAADRVGVADAIREMTGDFEGYLANNGRLTGVCCYCGRALTDARSTAVGYGPICADHYGLPWGATDDTETSPTGAVS